MLIAIYSAREIQKAVTLFVSWYTPTEIQYVSPNKPNHFENGIIDNELIFHFVKRKQMHYRK